MRETFLREFTPHLGMFESHDLVGILKLSCVLLCGMSGVLRAWGVPEPRSGDKVPIILCSIRHEVQDLLQGPAMVLTGKSELDIVSRKGRQRKQRPPRGRSGNSRPEWLSSSLKSHLLAIPEMSGRDGVWERA